MYNNEQKYAEVMARNLFFVKILEGLGGSKKHIGFYFILEILNELINNGTAVRSFSKEIYPMVAEKFDRNSMTVERDIRHFIDKNWHDKMKVELKTFWSSEEKPTCCQFIYIIKSYILMKIA